MAIEVSAVSDMFKAGITEDGQDYIGLVWYVIFETEGGRRFAHGHRFYSTKAEYCDDVGAMVFPDQSQEAQDGAEQLAERIKAHIVAGGKLDRAAWSEVDPRYGSDAYQSLDATGYFKAREKMEDR